RPALASAMSERGGSRLAAPPFEPGALRRRSEAVDRATPDRGSGRRPGGASCIRARRSHVTSPGTMRSSVARLPSRLALCGLLAGLTVARPAAGAPSLNMALHEGLLTADVAGTPVSRVMQEVGRLTGAAVRWLGA